MNNPKISICIPIYNTSKYLERCIDSLFSQTIAEDCEFIFVNDCSTDNSPEILSNKTRKFRNLNIQIINHEKNKGLAGARNSGILHANGEYIIHIDSDDWVESYYLEEMYLLAKKEDADIVCSTHTNDMIIEDNKEAVYLLITHKIPVTLWCKLVKKDIYVKNNISWTEGINIGEDAITSCKLLFFSRKTVFTKANKYHYTFNVGFSSKMKKLNILIQKEMEYSKLEEILTSYKMLEYKDLYKWVQYREAEVKYAYIIQAPILSIKKFNTVFPLLKLSILYKMNPAYSSFLKKLYINCIDKRFFFVANIIILLYKLTHNVTKKQIY